MDFTFNGNRPEIITFNNNDVLVVKWNGTVVWEKNTLPKYLAFVATSSGTFTFNGSDITNRISYSIDSGTTWSTEAVNVTVNVNSGDIVLWKGELVNQGYGIGIGHFGGTATFEAQGNIMSLIYGDNFDGQEDFGSNMGGDFGWLFSSANIESAENLELPVTALTQGCYQYMFDSCTLLETAPTLSADTLADNCYEYMFNGCSSLNYIKMLATDITATDCLNNWVADVAASGTFVKSADMTTLPIDSVNGIPIGWTVQDDGASPTHDYSQDYFTMVARDSGTFNFSGSQSSNVISYSTDNGETWSTLAQVATVNVNSGDKVLWNGEMTPNSNNGIGSFSGGTAQFDAQGNTMSLLFGDNYKNQTSLSGKNYAFKYLFKGSKVVNAENMILPATTLSNRCYTWMFSGCTSLVTAPELPATNIAECSYGNMFEGCSSLTTAPALPATNLGSEAYSSMFQNCTSLTTAPELPATSMVQYCYKFMFRGCTSLRTAPTLSASSLSTESYAFMFSGCTNLNYIEMLATNVGASYCLWDWTVGVASTGTFVKHPSMTSLPRGTSGIPNGWTVQDA